MTKLTTERLDEIANIKITEFSDGTDTANGAYQSVGSSEIVLMARQLLAYEQAAEHPAARITWDGSEFSVSNVSEDFLYGGTAVYLAPVLPKQPELIGMKVSIDTGSDNIGHRLFGEIVGTSDSKGVPVLCIEVAENNADVTLADEGETAKIVKAAEKLVRCKGRYHSEQNYRALAALFGVTVPDLPPLPADEAPAQPVIEPKPLGYFSYGSECGFDWHKTEKEAIESAEAAIDDYRGDACDGWSEETDSVCWGVILQQATKVDERPRTDDDKCDPAIDTVCDYALIPELVGNSPVIPEGWMMVPIEPTAEMAQAARDCHEGESFLPYSIYRAMLAAAPAQESE